MRKAPKRGHPNILTIVDRINRIFWIIVFTLSGRKSERAIPLMLKKTPQSLRCPPSLFLFTPSKRDKTFCLSSGKAKISC
jgi:rRNA maturation protein Rpf1